MDDRTIDEMFADYLQGFETRRRECFQADNVVFADYLQGFETRKPTGRSTGTTCGLQTTYKDLKLGGRPLDGCPPRGLQTTYKDLKPGRTQGREGPGGGFADYLQGFETLLDAQPSRALVRVCRLPTRI